LILVTLDIHRLLTGGDTVCFVESYKRCLLTSVLLVKVGWVPDHTYYLICIIFRDLGV
jgi:hypothetical protein